MPNTVEEIGSKPALDLSAILKLRNVARNSAGEHKALLAKLNALEHENLSREEKSLRQAAYNWILGRLDQAENALKGIPAAPGNLIRGGIAFDKGRFDEAVNFLQQAADASGNTIKVAVEVAAALRASGKPA